MPHKLEPETMEEEEEEETALRRQIAVTKEGNVGKLGERWKCAIVRVRAQLR